MGLDMYLSKKTYIGANYEHRNVKGKIELTEGKENKPITIKLERVSEITERVGYWRKANAIHSWFVNNVQSGEDDCNEYYVSKENLIELIESCTKDINYLNSLVAMDSDEAEDFFTQQKFTYKIYTNVDESKLTLQSKGGFFFGSTDYDEYYLKSLQNTIDQLTPLLEEDGDYYYQSSW